MGGYLHEGLDQEHGGQSSLQPAGIRSQVCDGLQQPHAVVQRALGVRHIVTDGRWQPRHVCLAAYNDRISPRGVMQLTKTTDQAKASSREVPPQNSPQTGRGYMDHWVELGATRVAGFDQACKGCNHPGLDNA